MYDKLTDHCKLWLYKGYTMNYLHKKDAKKADKASRGIFEVCL